MEEISEKKNDSQIEKQNTHNLVEDDDEWVTEEEEGIANQDILYVTPSNNNFGKKLLSKNLDYYMQLFHEKKSGIVHKKDSKDVRPIFIS